MLFMCAERQNCDYLRGLKSGCYRFVVKLRVCVWHMAIRACIR